VGIDAAGTAVLLVKLKRRDQHGARKPT
jgi:hypothetical protein